jgi:hypothetical protein
LDLFMAKPRVLVKAWDITEWSEKRYQVKELPIPVWALNAAWTTVQQPQ